MGDLVFSDSGTQALESALRSVVSDMNAVTVSAASSVALGHADVARAASAARTAITSFGDLLSGGLDNTAGAIASARESFGTADQIMSDTILQGWSPFDAHSGSAEHAASHHGGQE